MTLSYFRKLGLGLIISWLLVYSMLVNMANISVIPFTLLGNWSGLELAESYLVPVCHRMPSRSFWFFDVPMGLCARCTGIYIGLSAVLIFNIRQEHRFGRG